MGQNSQKKRFLLLCCLPSADDDAQRIEAARVGGPVDRRHAVLIGGIALPSRGLSQQLYITVPNCLSKAFRCGVSSTRGGTGVGG